MSHHFSPFPGVEFGFASADFGADETISLRRDLTSNVNIQALTGGVGRPGEVQGSSLVGPGPTSELVPDVGAGGVLVSSGMPSWMLYVGAAALAGGAWWLLKGRKKTSAP